jgi:hypothetical protein
MIKANELRLGNLVYSPDLLGDIEIARVYSITLADVMVQGKEIKHAVGMEILEPIPLTTEWIERFCFRLNDPQWTDKNGSTGKTFDTLHPRNFDVFQDDEDGKFYRVIDCSEYDEHLHLDIEIEHVHQLQNLYFALTGEELVLKETI